MDFLEQIKHPKWQKKRLEILNRDSYKCQYCGNKNDELHVHHLIYHKGKMIWEYNNDYLITYCKGCHECHHELYNEIKEILALPLDYLNTIKDILVQLPKEDPTFLAHFSSAIDHLKQSLR